jgi:hypothetical protein
MFSSNFNSVGIFTGPHSYYGAMSTMNLGFLRVATPANQTSVVDKNTTSANNNTVVDSTKISKTD